MRKSDTGLVPTLRRRLLTATLFSAGFVLVLVRPGCEGSPQLDGVVHPTPDGIVLGAAPVLFLSVEEEGPDTRRSRHHRAPFATSRIGVLDGVEGEVFGQIRDVEVHDSGRIVVLDSQSSKLSVFDRDGALLQILGRPGDGPGELNHPRAITFASDGSLYVFGALGRVTVFAPEGDSLRYLRSYRLRRTLADACALGDLIFVHGVSRGDNRVIQSYDLDGELLASFGVVYRDGTPLIQEQLSKGRLACLDDPPRVVLAPAALPLLRAFDPSGTPLWSARLDRFTPIKAYRTAKGSALQFPESGYHVNQTLTSSADGRDLLLQVALITGESRRDQDRYQRLHTFLVYGDGSTGEYLGERWGPVLATTRTAFLTVEEDPFPRIAAYPSTWGNEVH